VRRLHALIAGLPPDAAIHRDGELWTTQSNLAASTLELIDRWGRTNAALLISQINWKQDSYRRDALKNLGEQLRIPRPGAELAEPTKPTSDEAVIRQWFAKIGR